MGPSRPRVAIIGGGIVGAAAAHYLSRAGAIVTLVERGGLAAGASGACNGYLWLSTKKPGLHRELAQASLELLGGFVAETGSDIELDRSGELLLVDSESQRDDVHSFVSRQQQAGIEAQVLTPKQAVELQPALSAASIAGAVYSPAGVLLNPLRLVGAFAAAARDRGAEIRLGSEVSGVEVVGSRAVAVRTTDGTIPADFVVNAAGAWAPALAAMVGVTLPITPQRGQLIVTEPIDKIFAVPTLQFEYVELKRDLPRLIQRTSAGVTCSVSQGARGNVYIGSSKEFVGFDNGTTLSTLREIARKALAYYPALGRVRAVRSYAGLRPYTEDGLPILGPVEGLEGFVVAAGHGGDGIGLGAVSGSLVADFIVAGRFGPALDELALRRFRKREASQASVNPR